MISMYLKSNTALVKSSGDYRLHEIAKLTEFGLSFTL